MEAAGQYEPFPQKPAPASHHWHDVEDALLEAYPHEIFDIKSIRAYPGEPLRVLALRGPNGTPTVVSFPRL